MEEILIGSNAVDDVGADEETQQPDVDATTGDADTERTRSTGLWRRENYETLCRDIDLILQ